MSIYLSRLISHNLIVLDAFIIFGEETPTFSCSSLSGTLESSVRSRVQRLVSSEIEMESVAHRARGAAIMFQKVKQPECGAEHQRSLTRSRTSGASPPHPKTFSLSVTRHKGKLAVFNW
jgi:hypothetical protein